MSSRQYGERIPCNPETPCPLRDLSACHEDIHHEAYPRKQYRTALEKQFRNHILNKVLMCRTMHNEEHAQFLPPKKPTPDEMRQFMSTENQQGEIA